jgi:hypothetical protein
MSRWYCNKSKSQLTSPTPAQAASCCIISGTYSISPFYGVKQLKPESQLKKVIYGLSLHSSVLYRPRYFRDSQLSTNKYKTTTTTTTKLILRRWYCIIIIDYIMALLASQGCFRGRLGSGQKYFLCACKLHKQSNQQWERQYTIVLKAKETKKCHHHHHLMSADAVEFSQLWRMRTLLCYELSADSWAPAVGADWAVTYIVLICAVILEDASLFL